MNALTILLFIATILYMLVYQPGFYKYFFAILIPYYIFSQLFFDDSKINSKKKNFLFHHGIIHMIVKFIVVVQ